MIYHVVMDGNNIYDYTEDMAILTPELDIALNSAGSLSFVMPPTHKYYNYPKVLTSDVEVYENDKLIWFGRVLETSTAFNKNREIQCEGALAFFNDSIQRPAVFDSTTVHSFFRTVIENHNGQVPVNRQFTVGDITVENKSIYRELNYECTLDVINQMCLDAEGGYLFFHKENGANYIDWLADMPYTATQPVQFGLNLVDLRQRVNGSEIRTAVIPLGKEIDGVKLTVADGNSGRDCIESDAVAEYGKITQVVEFSDIDNVNDLLEAGHKWLEEQQLDPLTIDCTAAELHYLDGSYSPFRVGQMVNVTSTPHLINQSLPLTKMHIQLDSATKQISVGTQEKRQLTEIYKTS